MAYPPSQRRLSEPPLAKGSGKIRDWSPHLKPPRIRRRWWTVVIVLITFALGWRLWLKREYLNSWASRPSAPTNSPDEDWKVPRQAVKEAFQTSWNTYKIHAWGNDSFHPISKTGSLMSPKGLGWIIVDSLDTLMIMNLTAELADARLWLSRKLDYNQSQDVNTFETTIRMLGGLLSAHYLTTMMPDVASRRDYVYLAQANALAQKLLGAYDSPSGVPYASIYLDSGLGKKAHMESGASSTAEATTLQLEMKYLASLTGNATYWEKAERAMKVIDDNAVKDGLVPILVSPETGKFTTNSIRLGSRGDSYYEYLIKQYLQTGERIYLDMWQEALEGIKKHLIIPTKRSQLSMVAELPYGVGGSPSPKMDHLVCFLPGSIALGATGGLTEAAAKKLKTWNQRKADEMELARELMKTCWGMYAVTATGLAPEIAWFNVDEEYIRHDPIIRKFRSNDQMLDWKQDYQIKPQDAHNLQRPETVESLFMMWRITKDPIYRQWGWEIFQSFREHTMLENGGYTSLDDVTRIPAPRRDNMESFWLAETLKYLYLLFSPDDLLPLTDVVFNTEAHIFPVIKDTKFKTGWQRRPRKSTSV